MRCETRAEGQRSSVIKKLWLGHRQRNAKNSGGRSGAGRNHCVTKTTRTSCMLTKYTLSVVCHLVCIPGVTNIYVTRFLFFQPCVDPGVYSGVGEKFRHRKHSIIARKDPLDNCTIFVPVAEGKFARYNTKLDDPPRSNNVTRSDVRYR